MSTRVVHLKREAFDIRIDRATEWGNPFRIGPNCTRAEAIEKYRKWLWEHVREDEGLIRKLASLHGKTLGCWCAPHPCHGDVLVRASEWAHKQLQG